MVPEQFGVFSRERECRRDVGWFCHKWPRVDCALESTLKGQGVRLYGSETLFRATSG